MRILEFVGADGSIRAGRIDGDEIVDLGTDLRSLLAGADPVDGDRTPMADVRVAPLLARHGRVFAAGLNYEKKYPAGKQPPTPTYPPWFGKLPGTLVAHEEPVVAPSVSVSFDYEAELAAIIGTGGRHIAAPDALDHVAGYTCLNDGSVREWQRHSVNAGKNFERSGSVGPWMITADEVADPQDLRLTATVDGELRQDTSTAAMIFTTAEIIAYLSQSIELLPGDVIATGSPEGTGGSFDPPKFLVAGQTLEVEIASGGRSLCLLRNPVIAEADA